MVNDFKVNLESLLYGYYIKYDRLEQALREAYGTDPGFPAIDIYVDLYDMYRAIYSREIYATKKLVIVSSAINLAAHMRNFFWTRYRTATRIFLVYGEDSTFNHKQFYESFGNDKFKDNIEYDKNNSFINSQLDLLKILVAYIDGVYLIKRMAHASMFIFDNLNKNPDIPALILTKDKYCYQIPALVDNCTILRPQKTGGDDISYHVNKANALIKFFDNNNEKTQNSLINISSELLSTLATITGFPTYGVKRVCNINLGVRLILDAINDNKIINAYNSDIDYIYSILPGIDKYCDPMSFKYRFNAIDLVFQHRIYNSSAEARDISWIIDLHDPEEVRKINNIYFIDNPLDLNGL